MADVTFENFGGLDLVQDPQQAGAEQAISCLNVARDRNGRIRTRDGYTVSYDLGADSGTTALYPVSDDIVLAAFAAHSVRAIDLGAGSSLANVSLSEQVSSFAAAGSSGGIYFTDGTNAQIRRYQAGAFTSPASLATYEGNYLAVQPLDDRLVIADANNTDRLWFSNPSTPETITYAAGPPETGDFVDLTPGDGEDITGMCVFGTELFVFKESKFFVFYGNSTDSTGGSIFNYRMVDTGIGAVPNTLGRQVTATHETGVYFISTDGVYRTTGGPAVKVSRAIDPVFAGMNLPIPAPFTSVIPVPLTAWVNASVARDQLFVLGSAFDNGTLYYAQFALDLYAGEWTVSDWPAVCVLDGSLLGDATNFRGSIVLGLSNRSDGDAEIGKSTRSITTDNGSAISWHHQSGFYDLGSQNTKRTRQTVLWGSGSPTVSVFTDHGSSDSNAAAVTLGTAPAVARGWHRKAYRGVLFSHKLSGNGAATIHRIGHTVADERMGR